MLGANFTKRGCLLSKDIQMVQQFQSNRFSFVFRPFQPFKASLYNLKVTAISRFTILDITIRKKRNLERLHFRIILHFIIPMFLQLLIMSCYISKVQPILILLASSYSRNHTFKTFRGPSTVLSQLHRDKSRIISNIYHQK